MSPLTLIMIVLTAAIVAIGRQLYVYNRDVKKCNAIAEKAESKSVQQQLEEATGFTITRIAHGGRNGWRWVDINFTFQYNGYITKSAFARAAVCRTAPQRELKAKAVCGMKAAAKLVQLNWDY